MCRIDYRLFERKCYISKTEGIFLKQIDSMQSLSEKSKFVFLTMYFIPLNEVPHSKIGCICVWVFVCVCQEMKTCMQMSICRLCTLSSVNKSRIFPCVSETCFCNAPSKSAIETKTIFALSLR